MNFLFNFPLKKVCLYALGGGLSFLLKVVLTIFLTEFLGIPYFSSYIITLSVIVIFNFLYNVYITFKLVKGGFEGFIKYIIALLSFNFLDAVLVKILTDFIGMYYIVSIVLVTTLLFILKYVVYDNFVFTERKAWRTFL